MECAPFYKAVGVAVSLHKAVDFTRVRADQLRKQVQELLLLPPALLLPVPNMQALDTLVMVVHRP